MASALFGVECLRVVEVDAEADGSLTVWAVTDHPGAAVCPECGTRSVRVHEHVLACLWVPKTYATRRYS
jgi:hypothetical protein